MKTKIRLLQKEDFDKGFLETLRDLTVVGEISRQRFNQRLREVALNPDHYIYVAERDGRVVGSATLLIERKFIHQCGSIGHIEDVVTNKDYRGQGVSSILIRRLLEKAKAFGCYKVILDCPKRLLAFYERFDFKKKEDQMRLDL